MFFMCLKFVMYGIQCVSIIEGSIQSLSELTILWWRHKSLQSQNILSGIYIFHDAQVTKYNI